MKNFIFDNWLSYENTFKRSIQHYMINLRQDWAIKGHNSFTGYFLPDRHSYAIWLVDGSPQDHSYDLA